MLREERLVRLDEVIVACREAADLYQEAAELTEDEALTRLFSDLSGRRREMAREAEEHLRRAGGLPGAPDPDRETVEQIVTRLKAVFSGDENQMLVHDRLEAERRLERQVAAVGRFAWPAPTRELLERLQAEIEAGARRLAERIKGKGERMTLP